MNGAERYGTGRRKTATARVFLRPGTGNFTVNNKPFEQYFFDETDRMLVRQPLQASDTLNKFDIVILLNGGGMRGQAGAAQHGVARALVRYSAELRPVLKKAGFLTRDPRMKERKKYGQPGARKRFQFSKR
ncbi:MAG TPA: 30S ribosomal protein S9 [Terriglobia bacterium]|nr:30S ribosomal protein S9 [Terriglobia bacterium]